MKTIVVIGGGITGLSTLHYLNRELQAAGAEAKLVLIEKNDYLGGKIDSQRAGNFIMETGADSIVARHPGVLELVRELDFESELVYNETGISYIHTNNELHAIPAGSTFGIPMSESSLMASTLLTDEEKQRVLQDAQIPNESFTKDSSIGAFLEYFLGEAIVRKQIAPVLAGVYSGDLYQLSLASTLPYLVDYKNDYGSIMKGFEANREKFDKAADKKFISFRGGLSSLMERFEQSMPNVHFMKGVGVSRIEKRGAQYELTVGDEIVTADIVVGALQNEALRELIAEPTVVKAMEPFSVASIITLYLGYEISDDVLPADGTGFIVSHNSDLVCNASTWTSRKWKHTSTGDLLVRMFYKNNNPRYSELAAMSDAELLAVAREDVRRSLGIEQEPSVVNITKWIDKMPRYDLAHKEALTKLEETLANDYPNAYVAGASYYGVGIGACIQNGKRTAQQIMTTFR